MRRAFAGSRADRTSPGAAGLAPIIGTLADAERTDVSECLVAVVTRDRQTA
jgi:hypothetical protein